MTKIKVDEELLRTAFEDAWKRLFADPSFMLKYANVPVIDVLKDETKNIVETVLKKFRP